MSLFTDVMLPQIEIELKNVDPDIAKFLIEQIRNVALEVVEWADSKLKFDTKEKGINHG